MKRALVALLALVALAGCDPPSQADPARYGTVRVFIDPEWLDVDEALIVRELARLEALGPAFVSAGEGGRSTARVAVQAFVSRDCTTDAAHWEVGSRVVEIDRTCFTSESTFSQAIGHEIGHALGMGHVCLRAGDAAECSPVGFGPAMMNPRISADGPGPGFHEAWLDALGEADPTPLDLAEYRRVAARDGGR